ncbi:MAG: T9SS type A sorting domain-containing protein [Crocinitomicaceae bacterium]
MHKYDEKQELKFYPNPSVGIVHLSTVDIPVMVSITSLDGKRVQQFTHQQARQITIESGFYLIYANQEFIGKLVVQ